jgi:copper chaperone
VLNFRIESWNVEYISQAKQTDAGRAAVSGRREWRAQRPALPKFLKYIREVTAIFFKGEKVMEIMVKGMSCGHCAGAVTKALGALPGVSHVQVDLASGRVTFENAKSIPKDEVARVIKAAGYDMIGG